MSRTTLILSAVFVVTLAPFLRADPALDDARKALEADLAALRQAGEPTAVEELQRTAVPADVNAAVDLLAAAKSIDTETAAYQVFGRMDPFALRSPGDRQIVQTVVEENADALKLVASAAGKPSADWQVKMTSPLLKVMLPHLAPERELANLLTAAAISSHAEGDDELALQRIGQLLFISNAVDQTSISICHSVAIGIGQLAAETAEHITPALQAPAGSNARKQVSQLILVLLDDAAFREGMHRGMRSERMMVADLALAIADGRVSVRDLREIVNNPRNPNPIDIPDAPAAGLIALQDAHAAMPYLNGIVAATKEHDYPSTRAKLPTRPQFAKDRYFASLAVTTADRSFAHHYRHLAARRLAAAALAARCYALDHQGTLPGVLLDLTPKYLPAVPTDPFTADQPIRYLSDKGIVYSVGPDGKDDGGVQQKAGPREPDMVLRLRP